MPDDKCCPDCGQELLANRTARGLCNKCYQWRRKHGVELPPRRNKVPTPLDYDNLASFVATLAEIVPDENGCWPWPGNRNQGYGRTTNHRAAHIASYRHHKGPVPEKHDVGHLCHDRDPDCAGGPTCKHRACVNPDHLAAQTRRENLLAKHAKKKCRRGHKYTPETVRINRGTGGRQCIPCVQLTHAEEREEKLSRQRAKYQDRVRAAGGTYRPRLSRRRPDAPAHWAVE